ncbi:hypothetical protein [Kozakia baliensis]|uniref:hypothetical protein n=1 Tax=Kozakia baliensis TaxID=153496 RepID=UPI001314768B|nr:hypothetical protein [Kozakia baliensis]
MMPEPRKPSLLRCFALTAIAALAIGLVTEDIQTHEKLTSCRVTLAGLTGAKTWN